MIGPTVLTTSNSWVERVKDDEDSLTSAPSSSFDIEKINQWSSSISSLTTSFLSTSVSSPLPQDSFSEECNGLDSPAKGLSNGYNRQNMFFKSTYNSTNTNENTTNPYGIMVTATDKLNVEELGGLAFVKSLDNDLEENLYKEVKTFFDLPLEVKKKYEIECHISG